MPSITSYAHDLPVGGALAMQQPPDGVNMTVELLRSKGTPLQSGAWP